MTAPPRSRRGQLDFLPLERADCQFVSHQQHGDYHALQAAVNTSWTFVLDDPPPSPAVLQTVKAVVSIPLPSPILAHTTHAGYSRGLRDQPARRQCRRCKGGAPDVAVL